MKRKLVLLNLFIVLTLLVTACAYFQGKPTGLTPEQEFLARAQSFYISQFNDYKAMAAMPNLTDDQKVVLRTKKDILVKVEQPLKIYSQIVYSGGVPSKDLELQIITLLNQLGGTF